MTGRDICDRIKPKPTLGFFYTIQPGDTLLGVAGRASGAPPGAERLEAARVINDAVYNDRFRGVPNKLFPNGQVSFSPRFAEDPNAQAAQDGSAPGGHEYATIWLAAVPGDEPDLEPEPEPVPEPEPEPEPGSDDTPPPRPKRDYVDWEELHRGISVRADTTEYVFLRPETIPIIIIPGISGSAIEPRSERDRRRNGPGWPLNNVGQMLKILVRGARGKRRNLIGRGRHSPDYLRVIGGNNPRVRDNEAGLLGVAKMKYEPFVNRINDRNAIRKDPNKKPDTPLRHHYFRTPPHCFGYNWTADIAISGRALLDFVKSLGTYYAGDRGRCERVILVTHSTGGLVARSAFQQDPSFAERVVAVYHNGVPHVGAAEAYYRVKSGFPQDTPADKLVSWVTMRNGIEAGALFGNIPGGLQLLPAAGYRTNAGDPGWLELDSGQHGRQRYPVGEPYTEIYTNPNHLWGLIDKELLDPRMSADPDAEFEHYKQMVEDIVETLHEDLVGVEFSNAIQVVSSGLGTPDEITLSATSDEATVNDFLGTTPFYPHRRNQGEYKVVGRLDPDDSTLWYLELGPRAGDGDATVPTSVADGTHSGGPYQQINVSEAPHADMLMNVSVQWEILESIEEQLDQLIASYENSLRQRA